MPSFSFSFSLKLERNRVPPDYHLIPAFINSPDQFLFSAFGTSPLESTEDHPLNTAEIHMCVSVLILPFLSKFQRDISQFLTFPKIFIETDLARYTFTYVGSICKGDCFWDDHLG